MADAWICPDCGEPNDGDLCSKCGATPLVEARSVEHLFWFQGLRHGDPLSTLAARLILILLILIVVLAIGPCYAR